MLVASSGEVMFECFPCDRPWLSNQILIYFVMHPTVIVIQMS